MKTTVKFSGLIILVAALALCGCGKKSFTSWKFIASPDTTAQLKSFVTEKEAQADSVPDASSAEFTAFFAAAKSGNWLAVSNVFANFQNHAPQYSHAGTNDERLTGTPWAAVLETFGAFEALHNAGEKYFNLYASDVIQSIPAGSIYFGGSDNGRFIITAMQKSQVNGDPFFTLTQNALADGGYLDYLRSMYGDKIYIPTSEDSQKCFNDYSADAKSRLQNHQLKRGENVRVDQNGKVQVSGMVAVMAVNGLIAKVILDKNTSQDFYVQQSFPLDWMYPYLEPHGIIFKLNYEPLTELSDDTIQQDQDYWTKIVSPMVGDWLNDDTPVKDVTSFAQKVYFKHDYSGFKGDRGFVENSYASGVFAWDRSNIAQLYVWRMKQAATAGEKERMARAADFAFRQAVALCPSIKQTAFDYADFLTSQNRRDDAALVYQIAGRFPNRR
jgi:hypothetical protein